MAAIRAAVAAFATTAAVTLAPWALFAQDVPDASSDASSADAAASDAALPPAPTTCPSGAAGCAYAPIAFDHRVALPLEFNYDTGWVPAGSPLQVRITAVLAGHTEVRAAGWLEGSWPTPLVLRAPPAAGTGLLSIDWGVQFNAQVRINIDVDGTSYGWTGGVPYVPTIDFRATASTAFDPWAWEGVNASGSTMRQLIADVPLTSGLIPIPGISGGLAFSAQADLYTAYHSTAIMFGGTTDAITALTDHVQGYFSAGTTADFYPQLQGHVDWGTHLTVYPSLYISVEGHRWSVDLFSVPLDLGPYGSDWTFDPSHAVFALPDVAARDIVVDFGDVVVGTSARDGAPFESDGTVPLVVSPPTGNAAPFSWPTASATIPPHTTVALPVDFMPTALGPAEAHVVFHTSDPDTATLSVTLRGNGVAPAGHDAGAQDAGAHDAEADGGTAGGAHGGCGCATAGRTRTGGRALALLGALAAVMATRRRRRA